MYYKYKSSKKSGKRFKFLFITLLLVVSIFTGIKYKDYFKFWEYSFSKIEREYKNISSIDNESIRREKLDILKKQIEEQNKVSQFSEKYTILLAKINHDLGEIYFGNNFAQLIIRDREFSVPDTTSKYFLNSIKLIKKFQSIDQSHELDDELILILAKNYFYMDYYGSSDIYDLLSTISSHENLLKNDNRRFYGYFHYIQTEEDQYLNYLSNINSNDIEGELFIAGVYLKAKQYTNAIMKYKSVLEKNISNDDKIIIYRNLGKIYFYQSLFEESLDYLLRAYKEKPHDREIRKIIHDIYLELDDKDNAKFYVD